MSKLDANDSNLNDGVRRQFRCSIPQRLSAGHQKQSQLRPRVSVNNKSMVASSSPSQFRFAAKTICRPHSGEQSRPKSANKMKDEVAPKPTHCCSHRPLRSDHSRSTTARKPSVIPKRVTNDTGSSKPTKPTILISAVSQVYLFSRRTFRHLCRCRGRGVTNCYLRLPKTIRDQNKDNRLSKIPTKTLYTNRAVLPNQDVIDKHEDLELQQSELIKEGHLNDLNDKDSISSRSERLTELKVNWQRKIVEFDKIKNELKDKQKAILALYTGMGITHRKMLALGHKTSLPSQEELQIMNVTNLSPQQLLQLCAGPEVAGNAINPSCLTPTSIEKLYYMPSNLVSTCEQTLIKNKEIINLLESTLATPEKIKSLGKMIKEYAAENEKLSGSFEKVKNEFIVEFKDIVSMIKQSVNDTININLQNEQLICENSELNSQKEDLRKQLYEAECRRTTGIKSRIQDLEKLLKEEKCKNNILKDRLTRVTCQAKNSMEQASHMEAALEQSRSSCWTLERTVLELQEQNQKLHQDYSLEFNKFTESIRENTAHLEEIAEAREKLQAEKEDLEKRLTELSSHYNESIKNMKMEMSSKVEKIIDTEMKYENEKEERLKLVDKVESLCAQLLQSELRYKEMCKQLQEKELQLNNASECRQELDVTKHQLGLANEEIEKYRDKFLQQCEQIKEIERNFKKSAQFEESLKNDLKTREEYIVEVEKKVELLEKQLEESESKMASYEEQLSSLKTQLNQLKEDFGEFEDLNELHQMINRQRAKLLEATRQNGELADALQKKDLELEQHLETLSEQEHIIEKTDDIIKILSQKEEEHTNIIKLLRNNLEIRTQAEVDINQQLSEKDAEIENLTSNLDTRKKQICELEKIILTLENQTRKVSAQRRKALEKIQFLEMKLTEHESCYKEKGRNNETPSENLDSIIKILEEELIGPMESNSEHFKYFDQKCNGSDQIHRKQVQKNHIEQLNRKHDIPNIRDRNPTNPVEENYYQKINDDFRSDLDRQKGITNIKTHRQHMKINEHKQLGDTKMIGDELSNIQSKIIRNVHYLTPTQHYQIDKKYKTFKFAEHKL